MRIRLIAVPLIALTGGLVFAACGGDDDAGPAVDTMAPAAAPTSPAAAPTSPATAASGAGATSSVLVSSEFNEADVMFVQGMIPHHEQALAMAEMALDPSVGASPQVQDLATRISEAQDPEIDLMTGWLTAWGQPLQMETGASHDMSSMAGVMSADEMDALGAATGAEFDTMWLEMMIRHHEGAVSMADAVKVNGLNPEVAELANQIASAQQIEITEMTVLLES